jgi:serine/threonine protein kinase
MTGRILDGRYELVDLLGSGGMGEVWRCRDRRIGRDVAVKVLLDVRMADDSAARFEREARVAGGLASPSIVAVYDYGQGRLDGRPVPYLVMELVDGQSLDQVVAQELAASRILDVKRALRWTEQVCAALEVAHGIGVVHRDIKPANVMTTRDGSVKVLDFGIARFVGENQSLSNLTASGVVLGTAGYMSPEQAEGRALDHRTDLYSLGCLLYFLLTGRPPFEAESFMGVAYKHVTAAPEPPSAYRRGLHPAIDTLVLDLLAKKPDERPGSAAVVRSRLLDISQLIERSAPATETAQVPVPLTQAAPTLTSIPVPETVGPKPTPASPAAPTRFLARPARNATTAQILVITIVIVLLIAAAALFILSMPTGG